MILAAWSNLRSDIRYRLSVTSRVLVAIVGGYALTAAIKLLLALTLPFSQDPPFPQATQGAELMSYAVHLGILLWVFHTRSATRAWFWLLVWTLVIYGISGWLIQRGGGI